MEDSSSLDWWVKPLIGIIVLALVWGFIRLPGKIFGRGRQEKRPYTYTPNLPHKTSVVPLKLRLDLLMVGLLVSTFCIGILGIMFGARNENDTDAPWVYAGFIAFGLLGLYFIVAFFRVRHELVDGGIRYRKTFQRGGVMLWKDVRKLTYSKLNKHFTLTAQSGEKARVSAFTKNLDDFAHAALRDVPSAAINEDALKLLVDTTNGKPPNPWG